ncbi:MAG: nucleotidyltransferase family protein [bacterium]
MSDTGNKWREALMSEQSTIQEAISNLDRVAIKIVLVTTEDGELLGTVSDGDIRRGLLRGLDLNSPIEGIIHRQPLVVFSDIERDLVVRIMSANKVQQVPIVDERNRIIGLHLWDHITEQKQRANTMVIMAGGEGRRLRPHTEHCPKPLLPVAGKPMLERIIERAKVEGFSHFVLAVNYLAEMIEDYFSNGDQLGVRIDYLREQSPLGTAGALSLFDYPPTDNFIVTNGDVLTDIKYGELLDFHSRHNAVATMAVRVHEWQHPFGVVQTEGIDIVGFEEKPITRSHINAGIYALAPESLDSLRQIGPCDMPQLFDALKSADKKTVAYPMHEPWLDVGREEDLHQAHNNNDE